MIEWLEGDRVEDLGRFGEQLVEIRTMVLVRRAAQRTRYFGNDELRSHHRGVADEGSKRRRFWLCANEFHQC